MALGAGKLGYPDWQREANWDGPTLWEPPTTERATTITSPMMNVSRYAALTGHVGISGHDGLATFRYFSDQAGTKETGARRVFLHHAIPNSANLLLENLGPWCQVNIATAGEKYTPFVRLLATNRQRVQEVLPLEPLLLDTNPVFAGAETKTFTPGSYYAGPVAVWVNSSGAGIFCAVIMETCQVVGEYTRVDQLTLPSNEEKRGTFQAPLGAWQVAVTTNGVTTVELRLTAASTGSS